MMKSFQGISGRKRRFLRLVCALGALLALTLSCTAEEIVHEVPELLEPVGVKIDTAEAYIGEISTIRVYEGSVVPYVEDLYFTSEGVVEDVNVIVGQQVKAGDVLLTLNQESQTDRIEELQEQMDHILKSAEYSDAIAQIDLSILEVELRALKSQASADETAIALKELDIEEFKLNLGLEAELREMELSRIREELEQLNAHVSRTTLVAPFDGCVMYIKGIEKGTYLGAYTPVIYLADDSRLSVRSEFIPMSFAEGAHRMYAHIGGEVYDVEMTEVDVSEHLSKVLSGEKVMSEFSFVAPVDELHAGMFAAICVEGSYKEAALLVPSNAVYRDATGSYVYVVDGEERVRQDVRIGTVTDWLTEITEGIEEGTVVYVKD